MLCPLLGGFPQTVVSTRDVSGGRIGQTRMGESCLKPALRLGELCKHNFLCRDAAKFADETEPGQDPDDPFRRVDLPGFHSIPVIMLKLVVVVVIPFAEGNDCEEPRVASAAFRRIWLG